VRQHLNYAHVGFITNMTTTHKVKQHAQKQQQGMKID